MGILSKYNINRNNPSLIIALGLLIATRLITFIAFPNPISSPDSPTYFSSKFLDFSLVSFTGNAGRGWVVPFIYALLPNSVAVGILQLAISATAWCFLLISLNQMSLIRRKQNGYLLILLAALGSSPQIIQHDTSVLSTSLTNSIFILLLTALLRAKYLPKAKELNLFLGTICAALLMIQKTSFIPIAISLSILLIWFVYKQISVSTKLAAIALLLCLTAYSGFIGSNVNSNWQISYSGQTLLWHLGGQSPTADEFSTFLKQRNAPECITAEAPYQNIDTAIGKILNSCPKAQPYLKSEIQRDFMNFIVANPTATSKLAVYGMGASLTSSATNYGNAVSVLPNSVSDLFFGTTTPELLDQNISDQVAGLNVFESGAAFWLSVPFVGWIFLAVATGFMTANVRREDNPLYAILGLCIVQSLFVVVLLPSEWVRQTTPFVVGALIVAAVLSVRNLQTIFSAERMNGK